MMRSAETFGARYKLRGAVKAPVPSAVASAFPCCCQNHMSLTHLPSSGRLLQVSSPSKWRMGTWAIGPGSVKRRLTATRRLPCSSSCRPHQWLTLPQVGQKLKLKASPRTKAEVDPEKVMSSPSKP